jgi:ribosomal protein S18 acetylase RimI-like enzyme
MATKQFSTHELADVQASPLISMPARTYTHERLAELYNQTRVDYIVPMPMDGKRMADYIRQYDVNLDASMIAYNASRQPSGVAMLGVRGQRSWITRLGVLPNQRGHKVGQFLMERLLETSRELNVRYVQLEVIKGNAPAYQLFNKLGFVDTRELLVIRRPPSPFATDCVPAGTTVKPLPADAIALHLAQRETPIAWTEETSSLLNAGSLRGIQAMLPSGEAGWLVYQYLPLQLTHIVFSPAVSVELARVLIYLLHKQHPLHDTKVENVPDEHASWVAFQSLGYLEIFRRREMLLSL